MKSQAIIITLGEPLGVNVECLAPLVSRYIQIKPIVLIGCKFQWDYQSKALGLPPLVMTMIDRDSLKSPSVDINVFARPGLYFVDISDDTLRKPTETLSPHDRGTIAFKSLMQLQQLPWSILSHCSILTAPINKKNTSLAGFRFPGQTEFVSSFIPLMSELEQSTMMLAGTRLRVGLITNHLALNQVSSTLTQKLINQKIDATVLGLTRTFGIRQPRIAVAGLNPHCSDSGLFGDEEQKIISPAVEQAQNKWSSLAQIFGPYPADTVFYRAYHGEFDAVLCQYHDQGLGPLKLVHFDDAINVTLGLSIRRASPDHGPAEDLFLKKKASVQSYECCFKFLST